MTYVLWVGDTCRFVLTRAHSAALSNSSWLLELPLPVIDNLMAGLYGWKLYIHLIGRALTKPHGNN